MNDSGPSPRALLCALVLVPRALSRNRFPELFEREAPRLARRRAGRVRSLVRQLLGERGPRSELLGEQRLADGTTLLRIGVPGLSLRRTVALSRTEAAALRYALHRASGSPLDAEDREEVESALAELEGAALER